MQMMVKKLAQKAVVITLCICYTTLVLIWVTSTTQEPIPPSLVTFVRTSDDNRHSFQERSVRSVIDNRKDFEKSSLHPLNGNKRNVLSDLSNNSVIDSNINTNNEYEKRLKVLKTSLKDVFLSVKTTKKFHSTRLDVILKTWFQLAKEQTFFFTDSDDSYYNEKSGGHLINTNCSSSHNRKALCCKMSVEFDTFISSTKRWFCHFDDDNYVNVPQLVQMLRQFNPLEDWYLGKPSIRQPLEIVNRDNNGSKTTKFMFATGGAGFCLSRALALKMMPIASGGKFISIGERIRLPDDVTLGYIVEHLLSKRLTVIERMHSHLEPMKFLKHNSLSKQITFSYSRFGNEFNTLAIDGFDPKHDQTRFAPAL